MNTSEEVQLQPGSSLHAPALLTMACVVLPMVTAGAALQTEPTRGRAPLRREPE